jgi:DNA-binding GntR family transcriptional regulator
MSEIDPDSTKEFSAEGREPAASGLTHDVVGPVVRQRLPEEIAARLRTGIIGGSLRGGTRLREIELTDRMKAPRGAVREALQLLESEGLVERLPHRGATVKPVSKRLLDEVYSVRTALERVAMEFACRYHTDDDLQVLWQHAAEFAREDVPFRDVAALDIAFHDSLVAAAHHERLRAAWRTVRSQLHLFLIARPDIGAREREAEHRALVTALATRDPEIAVPAIEQHVRVSYKRVLEVWALRERA